MPFIKLKIYIVQKEDNFNQNDLGQLGPNNSGHPKFSKDLNSSLANTQGYVDYAISIGYDPSEYAPYNVLNTTMEGYSDWYIPSLELLLAMTNNFKNINLSNSDIEWFSGEYNGTCNDTDVF